MHTLSSARRTCMASASAVECTATEGMPSSRQARWMRSAISPRLAMRIFWNIDSTCLRAKPDLHASWPDLIRPSFQDQQNFAVFHRRAVGHQDAGDGAGLGGPDLVERLHRLDQQQRLAGRDALADGDERRRARLGREI